MKSQELLNIIKYGTVTEIKADTAQVKVIFKESNNIVSYYMPVLQAFAGKNNAYVLPSINDVVVCLISPRGESGVVIGSIYTGTNKPLIADENKYNVTFDDETQIEYDKKENILKADIKGSAEIIIDKTITISIAEDKEVSAKNIKITAESEVNIECNTASIEAKSEVKINGASISLCSATAAQGVIGVGSPCPLTGTHSKGSSKVFAPGV